MVLVAGVVVFLLFLLNAPYGLERTGLRRAGHLLGRASESRPLCSCLA